MFGSVVLDVAIGLAFVYALMSLICSALREGIEARLKSRALHLERGIREMLSGDAGSKALATRLYEHPLVYSLFEGEYKPPATPAPKAGHTTGRWLMETMRSWRPSEPSINLPSYIPARNFALALLDLASRGDVDKTASSTSPALSIDNIRLSVEKLQNPQVQRVVLTALDSARGDLDTAIRNMQAWYDSGMDRVSGWYKRETQQILFWLGLVVTVVFNVNSIAIVKHLATSETARNALVVQAEKAARSDAGLPRAAAATLPAPAQADKAIAPSAAASAPDTASADAELAALRERLFGLNLPIGWSEYAFDLYEPAGKDGDRKLIGWGQIGSNVLAILGHIVLAIPGWLLTAFAITFGAPFWFDLLNKLMVIRATVKPHEKSPEEDSEDRQLRDKAAGASPAPPAISTAGTATRSPLT